MNKGTTSRVGDFISGAFLFCFGLPFTLVPFMIFSTGAFLADGIFFTLFLCAFTLPFLGAGLFVQYMGAYTVWIAIRGEIDPSSIPRELEPGPGIISISEHPSSVYIGEYLRQPEAINGRDWYRKEKSPHRLYYYAQNEGGSAGWSLDNRNDAGARDWFDGGWMPYEGFEIPLGRKKWNVDGEGWVDIEESEAPEGNKKWWE